MKKKALVGQLGATQLRLDKSTVKKLRNGTGTCITAHTQCDATCIIMYCGTSAQCTTPC
jgi:hypothetical protein